MGTKDEEYMQLAISLAKQGSPFTAPNPLVGAVIVKDDEVIGRGFHARYGELHAERRALQNCSELGNNPTGAALYVTLEPCCHTGKQPPCTEAIIDAGISKVIVGSSDPNPLVAGKGISQLRQAGITVIEGLLEAKCNAVNKIFFHYITNGLPYMVCKYAMTLDGNIATGTGDSKWISGKEALEFVHTLRSTYTAIMVGSGTVLADDPLLTSHGGVKDPIRIVCDSRLRTPLTAQLVRTAHQYKTIIATVPQEKDLQEKIQKLEQAGCSVWILPETNGHLDLKALLKKAAREKIDSIFVEGGAGLHTSLLAERLVQKLIVIVAPKLCGAGKQPVLNLGINKIKDALYCGTPLVRQYGSDIIIETELLG